MRICRLRLERKVDPRESTNECDKGRRCKINTAMSGTSPKMMILNCKYNHTTVAIINLVRHGGRPWIKYCFYAANKQFVIPISNVVCHR